MSRDLYTNTEADAGLWERAHGEASDFYDGPDAAEIAEMNWRDMEDERHSHLATPGEAHAEWHRNAGVPMGTPGCPQDACHPIEDPEPGEGEGIRCAHCKGRHWTVALVRECAEMTR